jgi:hypothetical protein
MTERKDVTWLKRKLVELENEHPEYFNENEMPFYPSKNTFEYTNQEGNKLIEVRYLTTPTREDIFNKIEELVREVNESLI